MATNTVISITVNSRQAQQAVQALQQSFGGLNASISSLPSGSSGLGGLTSGLKGSAALIASIAASAAAMGFALKKGLNINAEVETAKLGIKSLVAALTDVRDSTGNIATGQNQLDIAGRIADEHVRKLRIAGLETAASFEQLMGAFQQGIGAGSAAGMNLEQIREITVGITQAAGAIGVPMAQLNQEVRSLLSGDISADSTVAKALGITNTQVNEWREAGTLAEELNKKLEVFKRLGPETSQTWTATLANLQEGVSLFMGTMTAGAFDRLKGSLQGALSDIFKEGTTDISADFEGLVEFGTRVFTALGDTIADAFEGGVALAKDLSAWLDDNAKSVDRLVDAWNTLKTRVSELAAALPKLSDGFSVWDIAVKGVSHALRGAALSVALLEDVSKRIQLIWMRIRDEVHLGSQQLTQDIRALERSLMPGQSALSRTLAAFDKIDDPLPSRKPSPGATILYTPPVRQAEGTSTPKPVLPGDKDDKGGKADADKARKAQQALLKAETDAAIKRAQAVREVEAHALDARLAQQLITYSAYLDEKAALERKAVDDEITAQQQTLDQLNESLSTEKDASGAKRLQADIIKATAELDALASKKVIIDAKLKLDKIQFERDVASLSVDIKANILDSKGQTLEASLLRLGQETEALLRDKRVVGNPELEGLVKEQSSRKENRLKFDDVGSKVGLAQGALAIQESDISRQMEAGLVTQLDGERQLRDAKLATAEAMRSSVDAAMRLAEVSQDPALMQTAAQMQQEYLGLAGTLDTVAVGVNETLFGSIKTGFNDLISGAKSFGDVLSSIISDLLSKLASLALEQALGGMQAAMGGAGGGIGGLVKMGMAAFGYAEGGHVQGPGTGTSDSIFAKLSNGEFVFKAAAVKHLGLDRLNYMNRFGKLPGFATGGLVGNGAGLASGLTGGGGNATITNDIHVSPNVVIAAGDMATALAKEPAFERAILAIAGNNGRSIKSAWG